MSTFVYYDLETGGLLLSHPILQIAAVAVVNGEIVENFEAKIQIDPEKCDPAALTINGYSAERWADAETPEVVARRFAKFLDKYKTFEKISAKTNKPYKVAELAGYNSQGFDQERLIKFFQDLNIFLPANYLSLDVLQLVMWYAKISKTKFDSYNLGMVCKSFGIKLENAHDALADVTATAELANEVGSQLIDSILAQFTDVGVETKHQCNWCWKQIMPKTELTQDKCTCGRRLGYVHPGLVESCKK